MNGRRSASATNAVRPYAICKSRWPARSCRVSRTDERSRPMRRVAPSVVAGEQLRELLAGGVGRESNVISVLVETVTRLVVQQLLEAEQADYLGGRGRYERRVEGQVGSRNGYEP